MQVVTLLHNPKAGDESHSKKELESMIESAGIKCHYSSLKKEGWDQLDEETDFVAVAGGDGTVRRVAKKFLERGLNNKFPLAVFPAGTANNIAKTLQMPEDDKEVIQKWKHPEFKKFDVGKVENVQGASFFLEGFGFGIFPLLMQEMEKQDEALKDTPDKKLHLALALLQQIAETFQPLQATIDIDGTVHSGKFLMVEVMNIQSIGPNLVLSPFGDPGDGEFEVILIPETQREKLLAYVKAKLNGVEDPDLFDTCKARELRISCDEFIAHVDDELVEAKHVPTVHLKLMEGLLKFLV
ncbi:diacylglycerol kinase family protein [Pedobacter sp. SYSU D00535]|uniref:diacylglycerol/lipid kinase family protein n=1 Tax=Pedobacter sp. SYSU D00535 TaxID=2810308 RepID=UPI001A975C5C|nr:diacylglycerol kinase family protein [Pedobacter sp. SYSU D00535]